MLHVLETQRLTMRPFLNEDAEALFLLDSNAEVMQFLGQKPYTEVDESRKVIGFIQNQYAENGIGRFAVIEKESGQLIGWGGLKFLTKEINGYKNVYELGYRFRPEFWGKGYATEAADAFLSRGFNEMNIPVIYAYSVCENTASNRVLEKLGFRKTGTFTDDLDGAECFWFELKKENYKTK